jgi:hypothetical protein
MMAMYQAMQARLYRQFAGHAPAIAQVPQPFMAK